MGLFIHANRVYPCRAVDLDENQNPLGGDQCY